MRRTALIAVALAAILAGGPTLAAEPAAPATDQSVTLATVALPLVVDGQLANYVFVSVKLLLTPHADSLVLRDKEPYFRDALVRAAHRTPFVLRNDPNHLDDAKLKAAMYREAVALVGPGKIQGVVILSETPQHRRSAPRQNGAEIVP
jgi:hypothetical protein